MLYGRYKGSFPETLKAKGILADSSSFEIDMKIEEAKDIPLHKVKYYINYLAITTQACLSFKNCNQKRPIFYIYVEKVPNLVNGSNKLGSRQNSDVIVFHLLSFFFLWAHKKDHDFSSTPSFFFFWAFVCLVCIYDPYILVCFILFLRSRFLHF